MSVYADIASAVYTLATGLLPAQINSANVTAYKLDLPQVRKGVELLPALIICLDERPEETRPFSTGGTLHPAGYQRVVYGVQVAIVSASNRVDLAGRDDTLALREAVRKLFQRPTQISALVTSAQVLLSEVRPGAPIARAAWLKNYGASFLTLRFTAIEAA